VELRRRRKIIVSEEVALPRQTVQGLMEALGALFSRKEKPTRLFYARGEALQVETPRMLEESDLADLDSGLLTPFQMVRQHCELDIFEARESPLLTACLAAAKARKAAEQLTGVVVPDADLLEDWLPGVPIGEVFGVPVYVDPETPDGYVVFCSSSKGRMVRDFEQAVACETFGR
jgi:hypothetical protein